VFAKQLSSPRRVHASLPLVDDGRCARRHFVQRELVSPVEISRHVDAKLARLQ
jgi:hypothetical protein